MDNPVTEVPLRKRSTPYEFSVDVTKDSHTANVYTGKAANHAMSSYWQAINLSMFLGADLLVRMAITRSRIPYGEFATAVNQGKIKSHHIPAGKCIAWTTGSWSGEHLIEKLIATIPGMPGPIPASQ
jgi:hypothetical protein